MITSRSLVLVPDGIQIGEVPPSFSATDARGKATTLSAAKGHPTVVIFGATWCLPCMAELPELKKIYADLRPRGVEFFGVCLDEDQQLFENYRKIYGISWPQNFDGHGTENAVANAWGVLSLPVLVLIGADGRVLANKIPVKELRGALEKALR